MTDFATLIPLLANNSVEFIIVGGAAATAHGSSRLTEDLDIVYNRSKENVARVAQTLAPLAPYLRGAPPGLPFVFDEATIWRGLNFTLSTSLGPLDVLGEIAGGGNYDNLLPNAKRIQLFGVECFCLGIEQLIQAKRAAGRPKDLEAIAELEKILVQRRR
ncbi:MAG: hypothetical protein ACREEM_13605 [Blastocatellia bacterium]